LIITSLGFGLFDPNMNAIIAQQCRDDQRRRDAAYRAVYIAINVGAMLGPLVCGFIAVRMNPRYGFIAGAFFSFLSFLLFRSATRYSVTSDAREQEQAAAGAAQSASSEGGQWRKQWLLLTMFAALGIVFWGVFDQLASSVTLLAERYVRRTFWSFEIPAGYVQSINPFLVILLGPAFAFLAKRKPNSEKPQGEGGMMLLGLVLLAAGFGILALGTVGVGTVRVPGSIGWSWIWAAILLSTVGEFLYVPMSMSIAARLAPAGRRGFVFGALMATVGLGSYLSGTMAGLMDDFGSLPRFFGTSAIACCIMGLLFLGMMRAAERTQKRRANSA
jgi:proton-dependent oligopeptide transporter, POT family